MTASHACMRCRDHTQLWSHRNVKTERMQNKWTMKLMIGRQLSAAPLPVRLRIYLTAHAYFKPRLHYSKRTLIWLKLLIKRNKINYPITFSILLLSWYGRKGTAKGLMKKKLNKMNPTALCVAFAIPWLLCRETLGIFPVRFGTLLTTQLCGGDNPW